MHGEITEAVVTKTLFGMDPLWLATGLFLAIYAVIISERLNRAIVALLGACLMIVTGVLNQQAAITGIDFNTLGLLTGMMVIVGITKGCGVFQFVAIWGAKKVQARPWGIMLVLALVTALFSALLDNVTTVLLIVPVTLLITEELEINPYPFLFTEIFASNIGGTATLIGDPPNIMIGSAVGIGFNAFVVNLAPVALVVLLVTMVIIWLWWGRGLTATDEARERIMSLSERDAITDVRLLKQSLFVLSLVIIAFVVGHPMGLEPATVAMFGAALLLMLTNFGRDPDKQSDRVHKAFCTVEWVTIFFFIGLFILVTGIERAGLLDILGKQVLTFTGGDLNATVTTVLWVSAVFSALVDNIPFVATMIPIIKSMAPTFGGAENLMPLWWSLALGACLGGNGSLIGASANVIVSGFAERSGYRMTFLGFMWRAFPLMLLSIAISNVYLYWRYLS